MLKIVKNSDLTEYEMATKAVKENNGFCPCSLEHTEDYKCMCKPFRENENLMECFCGRYIRINVKGGNK